MFTVETERVLVLDNGSGIIKAGWSGDELPIAIIPSIVGRPKIPRIMHNVPRTEVFLGQDANLHRGILHLDYPVENGIVTNWADMTLLWDHVLHDKLAVDTSKTPLLLTEAPLNPKANKEKMAEIVFEEFNVPSLHISVQAVLSLYANGTTTGIVLDSGDGVSHVVPIYEGYVIPSGIMRSNVAGRALTQYMAKLLNESGYSMTTSGDLEIAREVKEKLCYVSINYAEEVNEGLKGTYKESSYMLPDGTRIQVGIQKLQCPEALFTPELIGVEAAGVHQCIFNSISRCDHDIKRAMYENIVLSGGTTYFPNIETRLYNELKMLNKETDIKIAATNERKYLVWIGGSVLSQLSTFPEICVDQKEYLDHGVNIVHRKFF